MRKLFRYFSVLFSLLAIFVLASCSNGTDIKGIIETEATRDTIKTFVSFDKNEKLAESTTTVSVKLYNIDDEYQQVKSVSLENLEASHVISTVKKLTRKKDRTNRFVRQPASSW